MADLFDYLKWRGDLLLSQADFGPVDNLILASLIYVPFENVLDTDSDEAVSIAEAARRYAGLDEDGRGPVRSEKDEELLMAAAGTPRFAELKLTFYRNEIDTAAEMQFCAAAVLLNEETAYVAYRGTDTSIVGWREDFNMSFMDSVPAQRAALKYLVEFGRGFKGRIMTGGHSKGGNLAVYAAAMCPEELKQRITAVYNNDGPGFSEAVTGSDGYKEMLPMIRTYLPESSIVGMLLEHDEPYNVVKSRQIGILQHDPYSWEVMAGDFVRAEGLSRHSLRTDRTLKRWLSGLSLEERELITDTFFDILNAGEMNRTEDMIKPDKIFAALRSVKNIDEEKRKKLGQSMFELVQSALEVRRQH
ncbi:MAG: DUF2974 domain-containing protein [Clostridiales bacterium]|nr:DUF2974 domain-containing protein [Clostridiales bacterium]